MRRRLTPHLGATAWGTCLLLLAARGSAQSASSEARTGFNGSALAPVPLSAFAPGFIDGGTWDLSTPLSVARQDFKAIVLPSGPLAGRVLAIGGCCTSNWSLSGSELFDPSTQEWHAAGNLRSARWLFQAAALKNGSAVAVGGLGVASGGVLSSTELFVPGRVGSAAGAWVPAANMTAARQDFELVPLEDGRLLAIGGFMTSAEIYDPEADSWRRTSPMSEARSSFQALLLAGGRGVLALGGRGRESGALASCERFDVAGEQWAPRSSMRVGRAYFAAVSLPDGRVLVAGGKNATGHILSSAEIYDPSTDSWTDVPDMEYRRSDLQAIALPSGLVLVAGGLGGRNSEDTAILSSAEVFDTSAGRWFATSTMANARYVFQLLALNNGTAMALGGTSAAGYTASTEVFETS